jgi:hypothetical protein
VSVQGRYRLIPPARVSGVLVPRDARGAAGHRHCTPDAVSVPMLRCWAENQQGYPLQRLTFRIPPKCHEPCSRQHTMSEWKNLLTDRSPYIASAQCNEANMERQPFSVTILTINDVCPPSPNMHDGNQLTLTWDRLMDIALVSSALRPLFLQRAKRVSSCRGGAHVN